MQKNALLVKDCMREKFCSFAVNENLFDAAERMQKFNISGGPVLNTKNEPVGFLSEQDCIRALLKASYHCEMTATVADVMRQEVITVDAEKSIVDMAVMFTSAAPKVYPVVSGDRVVGVITRSAVITALLDQGRDCHLLQSA